MSVGGVINGPDRYLYIASAALFMLILLSPIADFITTFSRYYGIAMGQRFTTIFRFAILLVLIIICMKDTVQKTPYLWWFLFFGILIHLVSIIVNSGDDAVIYLEGILSLVKYHLFFLFLGAFALSIRLGVSYASILKVFYILIGINSCAIIAGAILNIEMFHYYSSERYGVKGIILAGNEVAGFLVAALGILLVNRRSRINIILLFAVSLAMVFCGTKAAFLGMIMIFTGYFMSVGGIKGGVRLLTLTISVIILAGLIYQSNFAVQDAVAGSLAYFEYQLEHFANGSIITLLLSGRDQKLDVVFFDMINTNVMYLFVGSYPISEYMTEMDIFDYIAINGIFGAICYFYYWMRSWTGLPSGHIRKFTYCFVFTFFTLGFLGGHMFFSAVAAPLLAFMVISVQRRSTFPNEY